MIGVFMADENGVEILRPFADGCQALEGALAAQAGVNEDAGAPGGDKGRIARAARGQNADLDDRCPP